MPKVKPCFVPLTTRQRKVHSFMLRFQKRYGRPPTMQEIADAFDLTTPSGALSHVRALERKGKVKAHKPGTWCRYVALPEPEKEPANGAKRLSKT